jgi:iron(II)-dependent oxidoreductase
MLKQFDYPRQPRVKLTWYEAEAYANWRGGKRPTEAQPEWAARGRNHGSIPGASGSSTARPIWIISTCAARARAGSYPAGRSWCGADDMAGNAWE